MLKAVSSSSINDSQAFYPLLQIVILGCCNAKGDTPFPCCVAENPFLKGFLQQLRNRGVVTCFLATADQNPETPAEDRKPR
jgi:hypothetical protein